MASEKAIYWLAVGVVALGLNSTYQRSESCWVQRMAGRSVRVAERAAQRGLNLLSLAEVMIGRNPADLARLQGALARLEARSEAEPSVDMHQELAQTQRDLQQLNVELRDMKVAVPHVRCPKARIAMDFRQQLADMDTSELADPTIYVDVPRVDVPQLDLRGLESLPSLQSFQSA